MDLIKKLIYSSVARSIFLKITYKTIKSKTSSTKEVTSRCFCSINKEDRCLRETCECHICDNYSTIQSTDGPRHVSGKLLLMSFPADVLTLEQQEHLDVF